MNPYRKNLKEGVLHIDGFVEPTHYTVMWPQVATFIVLGPSELDIPLMWENYRTAHREMEDLPKSIIGFAQALTQRGYKVYGTHPVVLKEPV